MTDLERYFRLVALRDRFSIDEADLNALYESIPEKHNRLDDLMDRACTAAWQLRRVLLECENEARIPIQKQLLETQLGASLDTYTR